jgi:hypothetical protein
VHQWVSGSRLFKGICCHHFQAFRVHKGTVSSYLPSKHGEPLTQHCSATTTHAALQCHNHSRSTAVPQPLMQHCSATTTHATLQCHNHSRSTAVPQPLKIGSSACRERVYQEVEIKGVCGAVQQPLTQNCSATTTHAALQCHNP